MDPTIQEIIKITPSILWFIFIVVLVCRLYRPIKDDILPRLKTFEAAGIKFSVVSESINAALKFADEINNANDIKSTRWNIKIRPGAAKSVENRAKENLKVIKNTSILWIDDHPEFNYNEIKMFKQLGVDLDTAVNSKQAMIMLTNTNYDVVLSDIARDDNPQEGLDFLKHLQSENSDTKLIFYVGHLDSEQVPKGAFGITNRPNELLNLTLDVLERKNY